MKRYKGLAPLWENVRYFCKWTVISLVIALLAGFFGSLFSHGVILANALCNTHRWTLFLMPFAGLLIVWLYRACHEEKNRGTDMVIDSISAHEDVTAATAPLIFVSSVLSHAVCASVGREGAALQLGGSIGSQIGHLLKLDEKDRKIAVMCGMSACFAAVFGTPLAAGIFSMEVISIGVLYYAALVPCVFASFLGAAIAGRMGLLPEHYELGTFMEFGAAGMGIAVLLGALCAAVGILLCVCLHTGTHFSREKLPNPYVRVVVGSIVFIVLTLLFPERPFNGSGLQLIERCFNGEGIVPYAFLGKILFTTVALSAGFKGGEIVPTLCVGATFGYLFATIFGLPTGLCAAIGMSCLFVSVTNCPVSTVFLAFELFGFAAMPYFAVAIAVSFTLSGYYSLYSSQKFIYSKTRTEYVNRKSH
ncbi:MAG: chloride channel protein [Clostridiales bacterium]|nr:chloride channel protein [Clostridiales bacterium]